MNKLSFLRSIVCAITLGAVFALPHHAQAAPKQGDAVAVTVTGSADFSLDGKTWQRLRANDVLKPGTEIRTALGGKVELFLNYNGPIVVVKPESHMAISRLDRVDDGNEIVTDTLLEVKAGSIAGYTQKMSPRSTYVVKNSLGNVNITGTIYDVYASGYVYVQSGAVNVVYSPQGASRFGNVVYVPEGFYFNPVTYSTTTTPPAMGDTLLATVNTSIGNVRRFNLSRGRKLEVTAVTPVSL